jgi:hypothetical protein
MNHIDEIDLARVYFLSTSDGLESGPHTLRSIGESFRRGDIYPTARVREEGTENWMPITDLRRQFPGLMSASSTRPSSVVIQGPTHPPAHPGIYRILALFFGYLGAHNFYAGEVALGISKLALGSLATLILLASNSDFALLVGSALFLTLFTWVIVELIRGPRS